MDGEEVVAESGGCDIEGLPNGARLLEATTSGKVSSQEERKNPPADEGVVAGIASDKTSAQVGRPQRRRYPSSRPKRGKGGNPTSGVKTSSAGSQESDFLQKHLRAILEGQLWDQQQLSNEWSSQEQSLDKHLGKERKETEKGSGEREQLTERGHQEESKDLQTFQSASQNQTLGTNEFLDSSAKSSSLSQQGLNLPDGSSQFNEEPAGSFQSSFQKFCHLTQGSSHIAGDPISNRSSVSSEDQYKNNSKEIKNAGNSQRLQQGPLSLTGDNQVNMLPTSPEASKARDSMSNIRMPGSHFFNDVFVPPTQGAFPVKLQYPSQLSSHMETAWMNHYRTVHSQAHSLTDLPYVHENQMDSRTLPFFTESSMQKEFSKNSSSVAPGAISGERSYEKRGFFSGSEMNHPKSLEPSCPDSNLISTGHNSVVKKAAFVDGRLLPNIATPRPPNTKQVRKSITKISQALPGEPLSKTAGKSKTDLPNPEVLAYKTKTGFSDQSLMLNKGYSSPLPTPWPPGGIRATPASTSTPFLPHNMSLSSPVPIVCSSLGEDSSSGGGVMKQDITSYPKDAHSAPPLDTCSNQAQSMRPPSAPVSTRPEPKSPFCCDECTKSSGASEKCGNKKSKLHFNKPPWNLDSARSNSDQIAPHLLAGQQKPIQSAFTSAQNTPSNDSHLVHRALCSQHRATSSTSASSPILSPPYNPLPSAIKHDHSPPIPSFTNVAKTRSGASSPCFHPQNTNFMHAKDSPYIHKMPPFYQASSFSNAPKTSSHNTSIYTNHIPSSYSNNNVTVNKPTISFGMPVNTKAGRTVSHAPLEDPIKLQHQGYPAISSSSERKLTHVCSVPSLVAPICSSSIYTCCSNTSTFSSSTQSNQSQLNMDSTYDRYSNPPTLPAPPSYSEVIQQKNNTLKNHDLLASQHIGGCKKLLWQPFSDEKPMIHIKTEVITGTYPGEEVQTPSQLPSSSFSPFGQSAFQGLTSEKDQIPRQPLASCGHSLQQAVPQTLNKHPMHSPGTCDQPMTKMKADIKPKLGENGTSIPSNYKQPKMLPRDTPSSHSNNKQYKPWTPKLEMNPTNTKNEIKCTFKIKNSEFSGTHFQSAFLNSCPKNTNIPLDKMNQISNALNETTKCIFNNKHPAGNVSRPPPPNFVDGRKTPDKKAAVKTEPGFDQFPDSSKIEMESDSDDLFKRLKTNRKMEIPTCGCLGPGYVPSETIEGPYYTHLGTACSLEEIKKLMEERTGLTSKAIRVEKIIYSGKEGKSTQGCPIAKWIVRRAGVEEKILCLVRQRRGHFCPTACIIICIVAWEGVPKSVADDMYSYLVPTLTGFGLETDRRCGYNEQKTCACQGMDMKKRGASFSFGCSWSMYFNGCKFARSREAKRFRLKDTAMDEIAESKFQNLATRLAPLYKSIAPESYQNQVFFEDKGYECRLGQRTENDEKPCRPFSGVTACVDFCAHAHKDLHNMNNGCTVVVTLTKHGPLERPDEEQLHVLPLYILDVENESLEEKMKNGCVEILANYPKVARIRATPVTPKRKGRNSKKDSPSNKKENALAAKLLNAKRSSYMQSQVATPVFSEKFPKATNISGFNNNIVNKANLFQSTGEKNMHLASSKGEVTTASSGHTLASNSSEAQKPPPLPANANMYDEFWKYFYSYGTFPPANFLKDGNSADSMKLFASHLSDDKPVFASPDKSAGTLLQHPASDPRKDISGSVLTRPGSACSIPLSNSTMKDIKCPYSVSSLTSDDFESPLHLLSEAVMIRSQTSVEKPRSAASHQQAGANVSTPRKPVPNSELSSSMGVASKGGVGLGAGGNLPPHLANKAFPNAKVPVELSNDQHSRFSSLNSNFDRKDIFDKDKLCQTSIASRPLQTSKQSSSQTPFIAETESRADCPDGCMRDSGPEVISAELEYNEQNFSDPDIGGVAIALTHGSVLFEVAKRELHATTALLNPNRFSPTRISLVFYQHKSMNLRYHGWYENERKLELQRQKRLQKMQEEADKSQPIANSELKPGNRKKRKKEEQPVVNCAAEYKSMWQASIKHTITQTTDTIITQWIDPQPTVTGPYQKWI